MEFRKNMIFDELFKKYLTFNYIRCSPLYWKRFQTADYFCFDELSTHMVFNTCGIAAESHDNLMTTFGDVDLANTWVLIFLLALGYH